MTASTVAADQEKAAAHPRLDAPERAALRETVLAEIRKARPHPVAERTLLLILQGALEPQAVAPGYRVLDRHGAPRLHEAEEGSAPRPFTLADLIAEQRAKNPGLFLAPEPEPAPEPEAKPATESALAAQAQEMRAATARFIGSQSERARSLAEQSSVQGRALARSAAGAFATLRGRLRPDGEAGGKLTAQFAGQELVAVPYRVAAGRSRQSVRLEWPASQVERLGAKEAHDVPVARIAPGLTPERTARVRMDDRAAARELTEHLLAFGHRDIAFIKGNPTHSAASLRWLGFQDAMKAAGIEISTRRVLQGDFTFRMGLAAAETILDAPDPPTAIFASNDEMALAVQVVAMRHAIAVPRQLSIVGFDDAEFSRLAWPEITTVRQPNVEMAAAAVGMLVGPGQTEGDAEPGCIELPHALVERPSSGPAPAAGR